MCGRPPGHARAAGTGCSGGTGCLVQPVGWLVHEVTWLSNERGPSGLLSQWLIMSGDSFVTTSGLSVGSQ